MTERRFFYEVDAQFKILWFFFGCPSVKEITSEECFPGRMLPLLLLLLLISLLLLILLYDILAAAALVNVVSLFMSQCVRYVKSYLHP
jgi:hypothetical protein